MSASGARGLVFANFILIGAGDLDVSFTIDDATDTIEGMVPFAGEPTPFTAQLSGVIYLENPSDEEFIFNAVFQRQGITPDVSTTLDFEDALLPSSHGWQPISPDPGAYQDSSVQCSPPPVGGGSFNLEMIAVNPAGWYLDLTGLVGVDQDWTFEADVRRTDVGGTGTNDFAIQRIGAGTGSVLVLGLPQSADGQYHNLRMEMDHAANEVRHYVDDVLVATVPPSSDLSPLVPSSNAINIVFGNSPEITARIEIDNLSFTAHEAVPSLGTTGLLACALLLLATSAGLLATRVSARRRPTRASSTAPAP